MLKNLLLIASFLCIWTLNVQATLAFESSKLGIHILSVDEIEHAKELVSLNDQEDQWNYVTIPLVLADLQNKKEWQNFFDTCQRLKIIPLVRLATTYNSQLDMWEIPTRRNLVDQISFLSSLRWPTNQKYIIIFNEVNHAKEWGGEINPYEYARVLRFVANWAHTEQKNYVVLPAGLDLAAPSGTKTQDAFAYLTEMLKEDPEIFEVVDVWNSHSYPNPGFSSSPERYAQNSLRGYEFELNFLKQKTGRDFKVMITETGWRESPQLSRWLSSYYAYAFEHIWSDDRILAVTPFVLKGSPGPFSGFSFLDANNQPTNQFRALKSALEKVTKKYNQLKQQALL
jgi:hypothetical protein